MAELGDRNDHEMLETLDRHAIDAHYEDGGKLDVATGPSPAGELRERVAVVERFGGKALWLDREAVRAEPLAPAQMAAIRLLDALGLDFNS